PPLSGQVLALETGVPLEGVRVSVEGGDAIATSGPDGAFRFNAPSACEDLVTAERPGLERIEVEVLTSSKGPRFIRLHPARAERFQTTVVAPRLTVPTATAEVVTARE